MVTTVKSKRACSGSSAAHAQVEAQPLPCMGAMRGQG